MSTKRNVKEYIGTKTAIECRTKDDWDKVIELTGCGTDHFSIFHKSRSKCFNLEHIGNYWSSSSKEDIINQGYTIYPASDFLEKEENLVGRYFKALEDNINCSHTIKGNYYKVESINALGNIAFYTEFSKDLLYGISEVNYNLLEFMPEGWTPESDKIEVFPDVFVGDYVVSFSHDHDSYKKGSIAKVHENSSKGKLVIYWKGKQVGTYWSSFKYHRKATKEQIEWHLLNPNVYDNVNDMPKEQPKQYTYEVVHCKTQEEWDFVRNKTTKNQSCEWDIAIKEFSPETLALHADGFGWANLDYYKEKNCKIYSFEEWCNKFGHTFKPKQEENFYVKVNNQEEWDIMKNYANSLGYSPEYGDSSYSYFYRYNYFEVFHDTKKWYNRWAVTVIEKERPISEFMQYAKPKKNEEKVDYSSPKVTIGNTAIDIIAPKTSNSVTLGQIQKDIKINVNFKKPVKI